MKTICADVEIIKCTVVSYDEVSHKDKMKCNLHEDLALCTPTIDLSLIWIILFVCLLRTYQNVVILRFYLTNSVLLVNIVN